MILKLLLVTLPLLLLSLLTYRMHDSVFRAWFHFARWSVPVIVVATIFVAHAESACRSFCGLAYLFILGPLYAIFIFGSLSKIIHTYLTLRWKEKGGSTARMDKMKNIFNVLLYGSAGFFLLWFLYGVIF